MKKDFEYDYSRNPAPEYACPVHWHINGRVIAADKSEYPKAMQKEYREKEAKSEKERVKL